MQITRTAIGLIAAAGVTAGAGGAFVATHFGTPQAAETRIEDAGGGDTAVSTQGVSREVSSPAAAYTAPASSTASSNVTPATTSRTRRREPAPPQARADARPSAGEAPSSPAIDERPVPTPIEPATIAEAPRAPEPSASRAADPPAIRAENAAPRVPEPAAPELIELVVAADSVIGLQLDSTITSERARVEDPVEAHVVRDVRVGDRVAIPAGSKVTGYVTVVERGGKLKERARLGVRFTSVALPSGTRLPIQTETVYREGESPTTASSAKIGGGAIGGAILGGILGGAKGAAIGGTVGAGAGTAAVAAGARSQATLATGSPLTVRIEQPIVVTTER
jgi:hypothetical protein